MDDTSWLQLDHFSRCRSSSKLWFMLNPDPLLWHVFQCLNFAICFFFLKSEIADILSDFNGLRQVNSLTIHA
jgi:hypothetical protein